MKSVTKIAGAAVGASKAITTETTDSEYSLSIVICTKDRAKYLSKMLAAVSAMTTNDINCEIIFVDNNSTDDTHEILQQYCKTSLVPARVLLEKKRGVSAGRNAGWRTARGTIIAFTDDDCYPAPDWCKSILACLDGPEFQYCGGRVLLYDKDDAPFTIQTSTSRRLIEASTVVPNGLIHGANFAFKRDVLVAIGGFDERLGPGAAIAAGEDLDLLMRASLAGFKGSYEPSSTVYHHHRRRNFEDLHRLTKAYAIGRGAVTMKSVLSKTGRPIYLKPWYWDLRAHLSYGRISEFFHQIRGAVEFLKLGRPAIGKLGERAKSD